MFYIYFKLLFVTGIFDFSFVSFNSFSALFIKTNSSRLIFESIKVVEIKTSTRFNLNFAISTILSCFFLFFLIIDLYFLVPAVIIQSIHLIADPVPIVIPTKEAKADIETPPVIVKITISE